MDVTSISDSPTFAEQVLRGITKIDPPRSGESDLSLELGLSLWMRQTATDIHDVRMAMLTMRAALVEASGIDMAREPVPLCGVDPRLDVLNLASYLRKLVSRAAAQAQCDFAAIVERALGQMCPKKDRLFTLA
jgi:hypothetical protein